MSGALNQQLLRLAGVLQLQERARTASREELPFVIVNETVQAVGYDQAALWDARGPRVVAVSGAAQPEPTSPYVLFLERLCRRIAASEAISDVHTPPRVACDADWREFLAPHALWCPLVERRPVAGLLLARQDPWTEGERQLLAALCGAYAQSWELARARRARPRITPWRRLRRLAIVIVGVVALTLSFLPVSSTAVAPAEVTAANPVFVRAPFAGVVDSISVAPNAEVHAGEVLVRLDRHQLDAQQHVAAKSVEVAQAQLRQAAQEAIADPRAREQLAPLRGKLEEAQADLEYRRTLLERADIPAPADGVAVFNDPGEWIGRPVETGERIMLVAPPTSARIEIELPVADAVTLSEGARVIFFDNINPDHPTEGRLVFASYATSLSRSGVLAYTGRADLAPGTALRLGLKGSAKIFGPRRPLVLWLLRRPLAWLRELFA
jgi:multidrug resistance efflux pump